MSEVSVKETKLNPFDDLVNPVIEGNRIPIRELVRMMRYEEPRKWISLSCNNGVAFMEYVDAEGDRMKFSYMKQYRTFVLINVKTKQHEPILFLYDMFKKAKEWGFDLGD